MTSPYPVLVLTSGIDTLLPWWWSYVADDVSVWQLDHKKILLKRGRITTFLSSRLITLALQIFLILRRARNRYAYILTFECGWESFLVAFLQTLFKIKRPRHVVLQFIMREKTRRLRSRIKYVFMRWCFSSVYLCVCSSRAECTYYQEQFQWSTEKTYYVPLHTDPRLFDYDASGSNGYFLSAGRTFRDYHTLIDAFRRLGLPLQIVASPSNIRECEAPANVSIHYDVPYTELTQLMRRALAVIVPLQNRQISAGQSVVLQAMTLGKVVIATNTSATEDYLEHMKTGLLVPAKDPYALGRAALLVAENEALRLQLGNEARDRVRRAHLPAHYFGAVAKRLRFAEERIF